MRGARRWTRRRRSSEPSGARPAFSRSLPSGNRTARVAVGTSSCRNGNSDLAAKGIDRVSLEDFVACSCAGNCFFDLQRPFIILGPFVGGGTRKAWCLNP
jgi:hypothetical protein